MLSFNCELKNSCCNMGESLVTSCWIESLLRAKFETWKIVNKPEIFQSMASSENVIKDFIASFFAFRLFLKFFLLFSIEIQSQVSHAGVFWTDFVLIFDGIEAVAVAICLRINKFFKALSLKCLWKNTSYTSVPMLIILDSFKTQNMIIRHM